MANKLNPKIVGLSLAGVAGIFYVICAALVALAPAVAMGVFKHLFHGIDITQIARTAVPFESTIIGLVEIVVLSFVAGWLFATIYNYLLATSK